MDGSWTWRVYGEDGKQTAESNWRGKTLVDSTVTAAK
jgi:hypothetical protein